jgi:predicted AAA+ superfamily ATPase
MQHNIILSKTFSIPADVYGIEGNAILGIRNAGKTYTAMKAAEELLACNIPIIVFDPVGIWEKFKNWYRQTQRIPGSGCGWPGQRYHFKCTKTQ